MKKLIALLALSTCAFAQHSEVSLSVVGNFNPTSYVYIQHPMPEVVSSNRSALGGGAEYTRWVSETVGFGTSYEQNPSAGKLFDHTYYIRWPQMRYQALGFVAERMASKRTTLFLREGAGAILTEGLCHCSKPDPRASGWSQDFTLMGGAGAQWRLGERWAFRAGADILAAKTGCYNDPGCRATWALTADPQAGLVFMW